jgi:Zn finger protein HypA/HybF involved in hydrogenase expression
MVFKKYYCSKCGAKLEKEKTHRVVTKYDWDYYQYHDHGTFPRRDYDVYSYRFKCPSCESRISFDEQCIIEKIQKKHKNIILSPDEMKENYELSKEANNKRILICNVLIPVIFYLIFFTLFYLFATDRTLADLAKVAIIFMICTIYTVFAVVRKHKGKGKIKVKRSYSHEKESQMERLHAYASHNKELIEKSDKCYCFHCKSVFESGEIERYLNEETTAICPKCGIDSVIPDGMDEKIDETIISEMHDYWF